MHPIAALSFLTAAALCGGALVVLGCEIERQRARRLLSALLMQPQSVQKAWVSAPDFQGQRLLFVKAFGDARTRTVAMDFEVDDVVRRFSLAGIRIGFESDDHAA